LNLNHMHTTQDKQFEQNDEKRQEMVNLVYASPQKQKKIEE